MLQRQLLQRQCWQLSLTRSFAAKESAAASAKKKKAASATPVSTDSKRDKDLELILASLNAPMREEPEIPAEERSRRYDIGRHYVIGRFRQHNDIHHNLACKIQLKLHAVKMLPRNSKLKEEAMKIDGNGPPPWRHIAKWTAPIEKFDPTEFLDKE